MSFERKVLIELGVDYGVACGQCSITEVLWMLVVTSFAVTNSPTPGRTLDKNWDYLGFFKVYWIKENTDYWLLGH